MKGVWGGRVAPLAAVSVLLCAPLARAAPCGRPDVDLTFPPSGALGVPSNAILSAHYHAPAELADETVTLSDPNGSALDADIAYDTAESMLRAIPLAPLVPGEYRIEWPGLRGLTTSRGLGRTTTFTVIDAVDAASPRFDGAQKIAWDLSREQDPCTSGLEDRFTYDLTLGAATDDQRASLLSVVVFETQSPTHDAGSAPLELAVVPLDAGGHVQVERAATKAGKVCFAAIVRDLVLSTSGGGDREVCTKTTAPPFFTGCAVAPRSSASTSGLWLLLLGLLVAARSARRIRQTRRVLAATLALATLGCRAMTLEQEKPPEPRRPEASPFVPTSDGLGWSQRYVRLPDDGEWRCAELEGVTLCAGGEPPAGVVLASALRGYRCGERRGSRNHERVCVDAAPDYPPGGAGGYHCRFAAEHGLTRECRPAESAQKARAPLPARAPDCWLDADCAGPCERGFCATRRP